MNIDIDKRSGFCFGVVYAIQKAEDLLKTDGELYCLGDIVHNSVEVERLEKMGLKTIDHEQLKKLRNCKVLIRAHGEPPETYKTAFENGIELVDASCPVVLQLQNKIKSGNEFEDDGQLVIYGKKGHAEVNGLVGQTDGKAIVIESVKDLEKVDFSKNIRLFSQTTKSISGLQLVKEKIEDELANSDHGISFEFNDTVCRQVSARNKDLLKFSSAHDIIVFVSGKKSSNGKMLFEVCKKENERSYFVSDCEDVRQEWFKDEDKVGICGATSTPMWLMEKIAEQIRQYKLES